MGGAKSDRNIGVKRFQVANPLGGPPGYDARYKCTRRDTCLLCYHSDRVGICFSFKYARHVTEQSSFDCEARVNGGCFDSASLPLCPIYW